MKNIPYGKQSIDIWDVLSVCRSLVSPYLTQGPSVKKFEQEICKVTGSDYCLATNSATSSLVLAYSALGLTNNDLVWTTSITFVATSNAAIHNGCRIDFIDIDQNTGLMCLDSLELKLKKAEDEADLPKCICIVHLYGLSVNMVRLKMLSNVYKFKILEDSSHALGSIYNNQEIGSCSHSDVSVFSFHPVKNITTGEGGCLTTNSIDIYEKAKLLSSHGITKDYNKFVVKKSYPWSYEQHRLGYNFRMTDIQAALGISQLKKLQSFKKRRSSIIDFYKKQFADLPLEIISDKTGNLPFYHLAVLLIEDCKYQKPLYLYLRSKGVLAQVHYTPVHLQPYYQSMGFCEGYLPKSEHFSRRILSIPLFPSLTNDKIRYVSSLIKKFFGNPCV